VKYLILIFFLISGCVHRDDLQDIHPSIKAKYFSKTYGRFTYVDPITGVEETTEGYSCFELIICGDVAIIDCGYAIDNNVYFINKKSGKLICAHSIWSEKRYTGVEDNCIPDEFAWEKRACN
jgi:hypothetical protein